MTPRLLPFTDDSQTTPHSQITPRLNPFSDYSQTKPILRVLPEYSHSQMNPRLLPFSDDSQTTPHSQITPRLLPFSEYSHSQITPRLLPIIRLLPDYFLFSDYSKTTPRLNKPILRLLQFLDVSQTTTIIRKFKRIF